MARKNQPSDETAGTFAADFEDGVFHGVGVVGLGLIGDRQRNGFFGVTVGGKTNNSGTLALA